MALIVQKFGGTSVATPEAQKALLGQVKKCKDAGDDVVLVVSAMGRTGDPYATDTLIGLLEKVNPDVDPKKKDLLMHCGEIISCSILSHMLETNGIPAVPMTGWQAGVLTNSEFTNSEILNIDTATVKKYLKDGKVAVVAGFQGVTEDGEVTTLGRGGSDTAAVALGGYLGADRVDIFTDVVGIAKVDPRVVPEAPYLSDISYDDMYRLAFNGAKVIHPRAVKTAQSFNIPTRVRSTFSDSEGTLISGEVTKKEHTIIGMALEKEVEVKDATETMGQLFIAFDEAKKDAVEKEINDYVKKSGLSVKDISWDGNTVSILLPADQLVETVQGLYADFHK